MSVLQGVRQVIRRLLGFEGRTKKRIYTADRETVSPLGSRDLAEYWIGAGVNYTRLWEAYRHGQGYIQKFESREVHLIEVKLANPPKYLPLFNQEVVVKSLKGLFHDLKRQNLTQVEYAEALPLFLYSIERGSGVFKFLGELRQLLMFGTVLGDEQIMAAHLGNRQRRIDFLRENFPSVTAEEAKRFVMAKTTYEMDEVLGHLFGEGISSIKISAEPVPHALAEKGDVRLIELKSPEK